MSLRKAGFTVTTAVSVQDALDKLELDAPDLIISETTFADGDGFELRRRVRATPDWGEIPFIFLTAENAIENKIRGLELGVDDYLTKPIYIKEIITRINILLQKRQRTRFEERRDGRTRFAGRVADMPVVDVIQTIEISRKSGVIQFVGDRGRQAAIYFRDGRVIDAEAGALQGEDAVYRLLTWNEGEFEVVFRTVRRREVISMSSQGLLMEGMRRLDEWSRLLEQLPSLQHRFEVDASELSQRLGDVPDDNNKILRLLDGKRTLLEVIDGSDQGDLECLQAISRLYFEELLVDLDHGAPARRDSGRPGIPLTEVEVPSVIEDAVSGPHTAPSADVAAALEAAEAAMAAADEAASMARQATPAPPALGGSAAGVSAAAAKASAETALEAAETAVEVAEEPGFGAPDDDDDDAGFDAPGADESLPGALMGGYRPSSLRLIDEAVAAAQAIEPSLFDDEPPVGGNGVGGAPEAGERAPRARGRTTARRFSVGSVATSAGGSVVTETAESSARTGAESSAADSGAPSGSAEGEVTARGVAVGVPAAESGAGAVRDGGAASGDVTARGVGVGGAAEAARSVGASGAGAGAENHGGAADVAASGASSKRSTEISAREAGSQLDALRNEVAARASSAAEAAPAVGRTATGEIAGRGGEIAQARTSTGQHGGAARAVGTWPGLASAPTAADAAPGPALPRTVTDSGLRMIGSLGRDRAEASGELKPVGATAVPVSETQRELVTILPRRVTREMQAIPDPTRTSTQPPISMSDAVASGLVPPPPGRSPTSPAVDPALDDDDLDEGESVPVAAFVPMESGPEAAPSKVTNGESVPAVGRASTSSGVERAAARAVNGDGAAESKGAGATPVPGKEATPAPVAGKGKEATPAPTSKGAESAPAPGKDAGKDAGATPAPEGERTGTSTPASTTPVEPPRERPSSRIPRVGSGVTRTSRGPGVGTIALLVLAVALASTAVWRRLRKAEPQPAPSAVTNDAGVSDAGAVVPPPTPDAASEAVPADAGTPATVPHDAGAAVPVPADAGAELAVPSGGSGSGAPAEDKAAQAKKLVEQANDAIAEGAFDRALRAADASLALKKSTRAYIARAKALQRLDRVDDALAALVLAERMAPKYAPVFEMRGDILWAVRRREEARQQYELFLELEPDGPRAARIKKRLDEPR